MILHNLQWGRRGTSIIYVQGKEGAWFFVTHFPKKSLLKSPFSYFFAIFLQVKKSYWGLVILPSLFLELYNMQFMYNKQECSWLFWKVFQSTMNLWPFLEVFLKADFHKSHINLISHIFIHIDIIYGYDRKYFHDWKVILINWMVIFI